MILESIVTSITMDGLLRKLRNRKITNNPKAIDAMLRESPVFKTVGELRELLSNFEDDTPIKGGSFEYANMQLLDWFDPGVICFGSQNCEDDK
jgi:hypothetical protein